MTDREHVHHFEWDADGWRCACTYWIEQVGSDIEDVLNEWARQKVCMRELAAQVAAVQAACRVACGLAISHGMTCPIKLPADAGREWLAHARARGWLEP